MTQKNAAGRMFQEMNFKVKSAKGKKLEQLIGVENPDGAPVLIYIRMEGISWSQYYLEECFGVWENWGEIDTEDEAYTYHNYAEKYGVTDLVIRSAFCQETEIVLEFETGEKLVLKYKDPDEWDGDLEMVKIP